MQPIAAWQVADFIWQPSNVVAMKLEISDAAIEQHIVYIENIDNEVIRTYCTSRLLFGRAALGAAFQHTVPKVSTLGEDLSKRCLSLFLA